MKVLVLGSQGMLGQMVFRYFSKAYEVVPIDLRYSAAEPWRLIEAVRSEGPAYVINCIGRIKQKSEANAELLEANSVLPLHLVAEMTPGQILIQPSTDCVFQGIKDQPYHAHDACDAVDAYGRSKRLGEVAVLGKSNAYLFRVSIIGPGRLGSDSKGLLGWFLSHPPGSELSGFANHYWNGITTLEWCKQVEAVVFGDTARDLVGSVIQLGTHAVHSKYDLLLFFQQIYETKYVIEPVSTSSRVNRALVPQAASPEIDIQLRELREFCK